jgi:hypothetical protein
MYCIPKITNSYIAMCIEVSHNVDDNNNDNDNVVINGNSVVVISRNTNALMIINHIGLYITLCTIMSCDNYNNSNGNNNNIVNRNGVFINLFTLRRTCHINALIHSNNLSMSFTNYYDLHH